MVCYLLNGFLLKNLGKYNPLTCFFNDIYYSGNSSIFANNKSNIISSIQNKRIEFLDNIFPDKEDYYKLFSRILSVLFVVYSQN